MKDLKIQKEEFDTNLDEIKKAEKIWGFQFPDDYSEFLLRHNGGVTDICYPTIGAENNSEIFEITRFMSIGDIILQKKYLMEYTFNREHGDYELNKYNLKVENLLTFAIAERGCYYLDNLGQIYYCNYSDGNGIVRMNTNSFKTFINSLEFPSWFEKGTEAPARLVKEYNPLFKLKRHDLFETRDNPQLGFERFKEVFEVFGDIDASESKYSEIANSYVYDRMKIKYLVDRGCSTDGLLCNSVDIETIKYLVEEKGLDINQSYKDRYPLQLYLTPGSAANIRNKYLLISELLDSDIKLDWLVVGKKWDGTDELPMLKKLEILNDQYLNEEISDKKWWRKNGNPDGHKPFKHCKLIDEKIKLYKTQENER